MPITAITYQLEADSLNAAYRPVIFRCKANIPNATTVNYLPPVVFCDVYINGMYYKTLSKTAFITNDSVAPEYEFDVQDAIQEVMSYNLPPLNGSTVLDWTNSVKKVFVKFRNTYLDTNGFIVSEQMAPVQGTSLQAAVSGLGTKSNEIYVYNAALQHEDNQDFKTFLEGWKTGDWNPTSFPLTKRPKTVFLCKNDSSYFPIITNSEIQCFELNYKEKGQSEWKIAKYCYPPVLIPIDCVVSGWVASGDCVNGIQNYNRTIITQPENGGVACPSLSKTEPCTIANVVVANNDNFNITAGVGGVVGNVLTNDTFNGDTATELNVTIIQIATSNPNVSLNSSNGNITVGTNVTPGTYTIEYKIYEIGDNSNPKTATATVVVQAETPTIQFSDVTSISASPFNGNGGGGSASGTITVIGGTYRIKAFATIFTNNSTNIWADANVNGSPLYAERNNSNGTTKSGSYIDLAPGVYSYSINVSGSGIGGSGNAGLDVTQL